MRAFFVACLAIVVVGAGGYFFVNSMQAAERGSLCDRRCAHRYKLGVAIHWNQGAGHGKRRVRYAQTVEMDFRRFR